MGKIEVLTAIVGIVILDSIALYSGVDGVLFTLAVVAIAGLGGYELSELRGVVKKENG